MLRRMLNAVALSTRAMADRAQVPFDSPEELNSYLGSLLCEEVYRLWESPRADFPSVL